MPLSDMTFQTSRILHASLQIVHARELSDELAGMIELAFTFLNTLRSLR